MGGPVALIQMPFAVTAWPSLGLSLLRSGLTKRGIRSTIYYFNLHFLKFIGPDSYQDLALGAPSNADLLGEWVFAEALWGADRDRDEAYLYGVLGSQDRTYYERFGTEKLTKHREQAVAARRQVSRFLDACVNAVDWSSIGIAGFTSVFQQHIASLALAKRLKSAFPNVFIMFGGGNCEDEMGPATLRNFPFVDAVCCGEGDLVFPAFAESFLRGELTEIEGIITRNSRGAPHRPGLTPLIPVAANVPPVRDMDVLPYPDYGDYFEALETVDCVGSLPVRMMFETSRGCWWGQKHHCTFCGLNGVGMPFRHKSPRRAIEEIKWLLDTYGVFTRKLSAADNIIPLQYFKSLLPELETMNMDLDLFYETKANLSEAQVAQYKRAGLNQIQPGIESMNSDVLRLMRKGVSALQNIQLLKWCAQYGVTPYWNYLFGFPGEAPNSYRDQPGLLAKIVHLAPPVGCAAVRFDRFSPYHKNPAEFGITSLLPYPAYSYIYPGLDADELARLAYYFVGAFAGQEHIDSYTGEIVGVVADWQKNRHDVTLCHSTHGGRTTVFDGRCGLQVYLLDGIYSYILERCATISAAHAIYRELAAHGFEAPQIRAALDSLTAKGLLICEEERFLAISIPLGFAYVPPDGAMQNILSVLKADSETAQTHAVHIPAQMCSVLN